MLQMWHERIMHKVAIAMRLFTYLHFFKICSYSKLFCNYFKLFCYKCIKCKFLNFFWQVKHQFFRFIYLAIYVWYMVKLRVFIFCVPLYLVWTNVGWLLGNQVRTVLVFILNLVIYHFFSTHGLKIEFLGSH
jgi:hypothetical protein